jgi:DNA-binding PadR family transcriptional regulator
VFFSGVRKGGIAALIKMFICDQIIVRFRTVLVRTVIPHLRIMNGLWKFSPVCGKERSLTALFILHSLHHEPKSGYDLLKEIAEKTGDKWTPSKGTLYPILKELEKDRLIQVLQTGKRSKNIFGITPDGEKALLSIREHRKESGEKMLVFKNLLVEIFGQDRSVLDGLLFEIRSIVEDLPAENNDHAFEILEKCIEDLRRIRADACNTR